MNRKLIMVFLSTLMIMAVFQTAVAHEDEAATPLTVKPTKVTKSIALDGKEDDWEAAGVGETAVTLTKNGGSATRDAIVRIAYNDSWVSVAYIISDSNQMNLSSHHLSPAVGVEWAIDADAGPHMGTEGGVTTGMVDIWHWELEHEMGYVHNPNNSTGGHGNNGLDDEWANSTTNRHDDTKESSLWGTYGYIADESEWIFEFSRPLTTGDAQDVQFKDNASFKLGLAYWDPSDSENGWSGSGHYISITEHEWITVDFGTVPTSSSTGTAPGFGLFIALIAIFAIPILRKKY